VSAFTLPTLAQVEAALKAVDQWFADREAELKLKYPQGGALLDAALVQLTVSQAMIAQLGKIALAMEALKTGATPTSPDDVDC